MNLSRQLLFRLAPRASVRTLQMSRTMLTQAAKVLVQQRNDCQRIVPVACGCRLMSSQTAQQFEVINVQSEDDFKEKVLEASSSTPVVVDFHATWCGPCKLLGPRLESLLSKEEGKVVMAKVDIDDLSDLAMEYGVRSVPTVIGVKNGKVLNQFIGLQDDDQIKSFIDKLIVS